MGAVYVQDHKLFASPLMFEYGDDFFDFVAGFAPAKGLAYAADVARIEAAWSRAYHAEDVAVLTIADLAALAPERLAGDAAGETSVRGGPGIAPSGRPDLAAHRRPGRGWPGRHAGDGDGGRSSWTPR